MMSQRQGNQGRGDKKSVIGTGTYGFLGNEIDSSSKGIANLFSGTPI
ncbi:MAG: hypothetical protein ACPMAG_01870 [Limisphaerales bacterium]